MFISVVQVAYRNLPCLCSGKVILYSKSSISRSFTKTLSIYPQPVNNLNEKVINVAILGLPNSGKSTLINNLVDRRVCAASNKVHTTKNVAKAICTEENTQIIFLDTPGVVTEREQKRFNLQKNMVTAPKTCLKNADIIGVIQDTSNYWTKDILNPIIVNILENHRDIPSFLILNKIDLLKSKRRLLDLVRTLCNGVIAGKPIDKKKIANQNITKSLGYEGFSDVFMVSALEGDGIDKLKKYLMRNAKPSKWQYSETEWTDQTCETLIVETVRAKFLDFLHQEIPYKLVTEIEFLEEKKESDKVVCLVCVTCPTDRIEKLVAGAGGGKLRQITDAARHDLVQMFQKPVSLTISLRVDEKIDLDHK